jgi:hypothetical protein
MEFNHLPSDGNSIQSVDSKGERKSKWGCMSKIEKHTLARIRESKANEQAVDNN